MIHFILSLVSILLTFRILNIQYPSFWFLFLFAVLLSFLNGFLQKIIQFIAIPINILTLGIFSFVINFIFFLLTGFVTSHLLNIDFSKAFIFAILLSVIQFFVYKFEL